MTTVYEILEKVKEQNLLQSCFTETDVMQQALNKLVNPDELQKKITWMESTTIFKGVSVYYIEFVDSDDEFVLNKKTYNKEDGVISFVDDSDSTVKWVRTIKNEYVLMCDATNRVGNKLKYELPVIFKK